MVGTYYSKDDLIAVTKSKLTTVSPEIVKEIMTGVTDRASLITAIERYNDTNKLPFDNRVRYRVSLGGNVYISVLKAYDLGTDLCIIGWVDNGMPAITYGENNIKSATTNVTTHLVKKDAIVDVTLNSYDPSKVGDLFTNKTQDNVSEHTLMKILSNLDEDLGMMMGSGQYRNLIEKFTYTMNTHKLNTYNYANKRGAYNQYLKVFVKYITAIKDILMAHKERSSSTPITNTITKFNNFDFVKSFDELNDIVKARHFDLYGTDEYNEQFEYWVEEIKQTTFLETEVETFKQIVDYEHLKFDHDGNPYWTT